jgi:hypothetical protein
MARALALFPVLTGFACGCRVAQRFLNASEPATYLGIPDVVAALYLDPPANKCSEIPSGYVLVSLAREFRHLMPSIVEFDDLKVHTWTCAGETCYISYDTPASGDPHPLVQAMLALYPHSAHTLAYALRPLSVLGFADERVVLDFQVPMYHPMHEHCYAYFGSVTRDVIGIGKHDFGLPAGALVRHAASTPQ